MNLDELKGAARQFRAGGPGDAMTEFYTKKSDTELADMIHRAAKADAVAVLTGNPSLNQLAHLRSVLLTEKIEFKIDINSNPLHIPGAEDFISMKVFLKRPVPPKADTVSHEVADHHPDCDSSTRTNVYDEKCALCKQIGKVVQLRRRTVANGSPPSEAETAQRLAAKLIKQYNLMPCDYVDNTYVAEVKQATYQTVDTTDPFARRYQNYTYTPPPPRQTYRPYTKPSYASNAGNFGSTQPSGSRMRANNPKGKSIRHKTGQKIDSIG